MTKSLARALAPEVRVLAVAPGVVDTGFVPGRGADFNAKTAAIDAAEADRDRRRYRLRDPRLRHATCLFHRHDLRGRRRPVALKENAMRPPRDKVIITCAVTGNLTTPEQTPHLPITPEQIADACLGAADAGAAIVHIHVRDPADRPSVDVARLLPSTWSSAFARIIPSSSSTSRPGRAGASCLHRTIRRSRRRGRL